MKVQVESLRGVALDWAVAKALGLDFRVSTYTKPGFLALFTKKHDFLAISVNGQRYYPSSNWNQGGPLLHAHRISISPVGSIWSAYSADSTPMVEQYSASHPLEAGMRVIVEVLLGVEIEVPNELIA